MGYHLTPLASFDSLEGAFNPFKGVILDKMYVVIPLKVAHNSLWAESECYLHKIKSYS